MLMSHKKIAYKCKGEYGRRGEREISFVSRLLITSARFVLYPTHEKFTLEARPFGEALALVECLESFFQLLLQLSIVLGLGHCSKKKTFPEFVLLPKKETFLCQPFHNWYQSVSAFCQCPLDYPSFCRSPCRYQNDTLKKKEKH